MARNRTYILIAAAILIGVLWTMLSNHTATIKVAPSHETVAVPGTGDNVDDACIWVHPTDPARSIIITTNKDNRSEGNQGGLYTFSLDGRRSDDGDHWVAGTNWFNAGNETNTVDIRYGFPAGDERWDLVAASDRSNNELRIFRVTTKDDVDFGGLELVAALPYTGSNRRSIHAVGMYHSRQGNGRYYVFASTRRTGEVRQFELRYDAAARAIDLVHKATVQVSDPAFVTEAEASVEGIAADDETGYIYIAAEAEGIFRYGTADGVIQSSGRVTVDRHQSLTIPDYAPTEKGNDIEGLSLYYGSEGQGYLIAAVQAKSELNVYAREFSGNAANAYIGTFAIAGSATIDDVSRTDGLDVTSVDLGGIYGAGMLVVHDHENPGARDGMAKANFKLVPWARISSLLGLVNHTTYSPRPDRP